MEKQRFTITVYTENNPGLLNRISIIFLKRHINVESLNVSKSEIPNVHRFIIAAYMTEEAVKKLVGQIDKQVEVIKAYYHTDDELIHQETALYKLKATLKDDQKVIDIIKNNEGNIVMESEAFFVVERTGQRDKAEALYEALEPFGIMQFARSGRIAVSKDEMKISEMLAQLNDQ